MFEYEYISNALSLLRIILYVKAILLIFLLDFLSIRMKKVFAKENMDEVSEMMQPDPVIAKMWSNGDLSQSQYEIAYNLLTNTMKAKYLLELITTGTKYHEALIKALKDCKQDQLAEKLF